MEGTPPPSAGATTLHRGPETLAEIRLGVTSAILWGWRFINPWWPPTSPAHYRGGSTLPSPCNRVPP